MNRPVDRLAAGCIALLATLATVWSVATAAYPEAAAKTIAPHASALTPCRPG
ncbi:MAG TPA: hypothetical protein VFJ70_11090 [Burkholderiales bacterium]|nr:hypothetical protein [Burkholderiales bacterium]